MFANYLHANLDDLATMAQAHNDPQGFVNQADRMVIDEAQRVPDLFIAVKKAVDDDRSRRFVLSGSANFLLLRQIHESLAGRAGYSVLRQPTWSEWHGANKPSWLLELLGGTLPPEQDTLPTPDIRTVLFTGCLPGIRDSTPAEAALFWDSYVQTYIERDLPGISAVASMIDYRAVMHFIAITTGSLLDYSSVANNTHISASTVGRYAETLRTAHLLNLVPPAALSSTASVRRNWKSYLFDTGLICSLLGKKTPGSIDDTLAGHLFEALVCMSIQTLADLDSLSVWFVRTRRGPLHEVDFIVEGDRKKTAIEVKLNDHVTWSDAEHLRWYMDQDPACTAAAIIYTGTRVVHLARNIVAVPWTML
jgi:predicted AAA+ superfamily ATPase